MDPITIPVSLTQGEPKPMFWRQLAGRFKGLGQGSYVVSITETQPHLTSDPLRAYYFGVIVPAVARETGYTKDQAHEILKARHLPKAVAEHRNNGVLMGELVIGGSITKLSNGEMSEYCAEIREWANGFLGLQIPEPDPNWRYAATVEPAGAQLPSNPLR
jgi:hypothetical protein